MEPISQFNMPQGLNVAILCHSDKCNGKRDTGSGPIEPLLSFFTASKARYIFLIEQPHPLPGISLDCTMEVYRDGALIATHVSTRYRWLYDLPADRAMRTYPSLKLRDTLASRDLLAMIPRLYPDCGALDFLIGMESLNALVGQAFRNRLGIRNLVYYTYDWAPYRYASRWMSALFAWLDKRACRRANACWNVTDLIAEARRDILRYDMRKMAKQVVVHVGSEFRDSLVRPFGEKPERINVIFSGGHHFDNGVQFIPEIARRVAAADPRVHFIITGEGSMTAGIKQEIAGYGLTNLTFTGFVSAEELDKLMCESLIGLAPYPATGMSTKAYGDVIKIRTYMACGLVTVTTHVPPIAREVRKENLGIVTEIDAAEMADAILKLSADESLLRTCRENVIRKAKGHTWNAILTHAVSESLA